MNYAATLSVFWMASIQSRYRRINAGEYVGLALLTFWNCIVLRVDMLIERVSARAVE